MENPLPDLVPIGSHAGWDLFYVPTNDSFEARKGRKRRAHQHRRSLIEEIQNTNATEERQARREEPCRFRLWDGLAQKETTVEVTSYTAQGLGLRPVAGGEVFHLKLAGYGGSWGKERAVAVIPDKADSGRLHRAVEMLRRAQEELRQAEKEIVVPIEVNWTYGSDVTKFFAEEDRLRTAINKVNQ